MEDIYKYKDGHEITIYLQDDGSSIDYPEFNYNGINIHKVRHPINNGKKKYWYLVDKAFRYARRINFDYCFMLPDDIMLTDDFFNEAIRQWNRIKDRKKIILNLLLDKSREGMPCWTNFNPIKKNYNGCYFWHTQWNDLCFISEIKLFYVLKRIHEIKNVRWKNKENLSSGVGEQISTILNRNKWNLYQVCNTLVLHGEHDSVMNKEERIKFPLIA